jgi:hypothetical protein
MRIMASIDAACGTSIHVFSRNSSPPDHDGEERVTVSFGDHRFDVPARDLIEAVRRASLGGFHDIGF